MTLTRLFKHLIQAVSISSFALSLLLLFPLLSAPAFAQDEPFSVRMNRTLDELFESKQTRYKREQKEADERRKLEEKVGKQQQEIEQNRREIEGMAGTITEPQQPRLPTVPEAQEPRTLADMRVEIFVASDCPDCERTEQYLRDVGVPYSKRILSPGSDAERDYLANVGRGVIPATRINGKTVRGYQPEEIRRLILAEKQPMRTAKPQPRLGAVSSEQKY